MRQHKILSKSEVLHVLKDLHSKRWRHFSSATNLAIFRLATGCGLRVKEIAGLNLDDVIFDWPHPRVTVRPEITKGKKPPRSIPLTWDTHTMLDLQAYAERRRAIGGEWFIGNSHRIVKRSIQRRWKTAIKSLGEQRQKDLAIHSGRRTFASHAHAIGHTLVEIKDALGHANVQTTSIYLIAIPDQGLPDMY